MPEPRCFVLLPATRAHLCAAVAALRATPVLDLTSDAVAQVPAGAWVRAREASTAPGQGAIIAQAGEPHPSRPTWIERVDGSPAGPGFAGVVLRG
ncbi:MAG: hypothetical protein FJ090_22530, partial [Deltaproteobacteria bacterium]|nr:hypothetical protein [Deltaproteobacteria bacterium]